MGPLKLPFVSDESAATASLAVVIATTTDIPNNPCANVFFIEPKGTKPVREVKGIFYAGSRLGNPGWVQPELEVPPGD